MLVLSDCYAYSIFLCNFNGICKFPGKYNTSNNKINKQNKKQDESCRRNCRGKQEQNCQTEKHQIGESKIQIERIMLNAQCCYLK